MKPEERKVMQIASMSDFYAFRDTLNLTDRQKQIFELRYSRGWTQGDIAKDLGFCEDIIRADLRDIRMKLTVLLKENIKKSLTL